MKILVYFLVFGFSSFSLANDGASSDPAGGLVLKKQEKVSINREILTISPKLVTVEYEFENTSDVDIETYVQFPLPPQDFAYDKEPEVSWMADHFELWIEGQKRPFEQDYKVFAPDKKKDFKDLLKKHGIPYQYPNDAGLKIEALDEKQKGELLRLNLIKQFGERYEPNWVYQKLLYWKMKFPARKKVNVKHSYNPQMGASVSGHSFFKEACVDGPTQKGIEKMLKKSGQPAGVRWVDYILTTAKTWDGPIKDFKLILKKEEFKKDQIVSTCFPGVQKVSDKQFEAQRSNFAPDKELSIFYFR